jgi:formate dehydrogenase subunit delta
MNPAMRLASDVAVQFHHLSAGEAAEAVAGHIRLFWDPRLRKDLLEQVVAAGEDCDPRVAAATRLLNP